MEQIIRKDGRLYYGERVCRDADDAYRRFRRDYNESVGRVAFYRLNRFGSRKDRVRDIGIVCSSKPSCPVQDEVRVPVMHMGMLAGCYCKTIGGYDIPDGVDEDNLLDWVNWVFCHKEKHYRLVGLKTRVGRTSKNINRRFK